MQKEPTDGNPAVPSSNQSDDRPLFVSLTSTADMATKVAMPDWPLVFPILKFKVSTEVSATLNQEPNKKYDLACFDPHNEEHAHWELKTKEEGAVAQGSYYLSSAPHMPVLQSHTMLKADRRQLRCASHPPGRRYRFRTRTPSRNCNRDLFNKQGLNITSTFSLSDTGACFAVQERPNRCNGTPYWLMEIDPDVVPDHSTIFTQRFIHFIIDTVFCTQWETPASTMRTPN